MFMLFSCGAGDEASSAAEEAGAPSAEEAAASAQAAPPADGERAGEGLGKVRVEGTIEMATFESGVIQIDAVSMADGTPKVVAVERYPRVGPFRLDVRGTHDSVLLVAYHDLAGDGPSADDPRFEYAENPVDLSSGETVSELVFVLSEPVDPERSALAPEGATPGPDDAPRNEGAEHSGEVAADEGAGPAEAASQEGGGEPTQNAAPGEEAASSASEDGG